MVTSQSEMSGVFELEMLLRDKGLKIVINFSHSNRNVFFLSRGFLRVLSR